MAQIFCKQKPSHRKIIFFDTTKQANLLWLMQALPLKYLMAHKHLLLDALLTCKNDLWTNDIKNVGKPRAIIYFFEMLGNFSIGNYFKRKYHCFFGVIVTLNLNGLLFP
ncbi:alanine--tRNA ligase-related protein [Areca yellow leaf disease phytoplasma]|uniref:alanine--tRNA ligase-related protein n=1 Tax=Areca yellow leaf disease phytoplasma TaxID=927614 RepID=UPI0035B54837